MVSWLIAEQVLSSKVVGPVSRAETPAYVTLSTLVHGGAGCIVLQHGDIWRGSMQCHVSLRQTLETCAALCQKVLSCVH